MILKIMSAPLPRHAKLGHIGWMDIEPVLLAEPDSELADSLVSSNDPDDLANEQTWPSEEEMRGAEGQPGFEADRDRVPDAAKGTTPRAVRRIPRGMSEYQASWIVDEDDGEAEDGDREGRETGEEEVEMEDVVEVVEGEDEQEMDAESRRSVAFQDLDMEEEGRQ